MSFKSRNEAARALLVEAVKVVSETGHTFTVVGGWSPVLLNTREIAHPGTIDVDLLFEAGATAESLNDVVESLLKASFLPSAKHPFQLLRVLPVNEDELVFNIDLLHPSEAISKHPTANEIFVDHLELNIPKGAIPADKIRAKSIAAPESGFIFTENRYLHKHVTATDIHGATTGVDVPIIDELGLIITKSSSVLQAKRPRDAFDLYLAIAYARDYDDLLKWGEELRESSESTFLTLSNIWRALESNTFDERVNDYMPAERKKDLVDLVRNRPFSKPVERFLETLKVNRPNTT